MLQKMTKDGNIDEISAEITTTLPNAAVNSPR